ncbi:fibronectin type III domain-containing protein [Emticicia sp. 17c]|uniref:fibronectin type III domain-containing protein n=1 Tax=Emticicia sp. 17c TaxID=3127704 RepID=UPI00301E285D
MNRTNTVQGGQIIIDEACDEITLDDGFETLDGADYEARIGNGYSNSGPLVKYKTNVTANAQIEVLIRPQSNRILIRWIPENPEHWKYTIGTGYTLERQELINGSWVQSNTITFGGVVENDYAQWQPFFSDSTYALIYYGITDQKRAPTASTEETFYRYFGVSYAFNNNFSAAVMAKHGYIDNNVVAGRKYRYKVSSTLPVSPNTISSGEYIEVETDATGELPKVNINLAISKTTSYQKVTVDWIGKSLIGYYSGYNIERSTDGTNFTKINQRPLVYMPGSSIDTLGSVASANDRIYYIDSLPNKTQKYYYRVVGKSYFNETQNFDVKSIQLRKEYPWAPAIDSIRFSKATQQYTVYWKFPQEDNISAMDTVLKTNPYTLKVSKKDTSDYVVLKTNIAAGSRSISFTRAELRNAIDTTTSYYYRLSALTKDDVELKSIPSMIIPPDKTPPAKPTGLTVTVAANDTTHRKQVLTITWNANSEPDLMGYTLQRRIGETDTLYIVADTRNMKKVGGVLQKNTTRTATDTLSLNLDLSKVYYILKVYDDNYNGSDTSMVAYVIPDTKRPVLPTLIKTKYESIGGNKIRLSLIPSPETGVIHKIMRQEEGTTIWTLIKQYTKTQRDTLYIDNTVTLGKSYFYTYNAYDDAGNMSCYKDPDSKNLSIPAADCYQFLKATVGNPTTTPSPMAINTFVISKDTANKQISLSWTLTAGNPPIREFEIYKAVYNTSTPTELKKESLWEVVDDAELSIIDPEPQNAYTHKYFIRAIFADGKISAWKDVLIIY